MQLRAILVLVISELDKALHIILLEFSKEKLDMIFLQVYNKMMLRHHKWSIRHDGE